MRSAILNHWRRHRVSDKGNAQSFLEAAAERVNKKEWLLGKPYDMREYVQICSHIFAVDVIVVVVIDAKGYVSFDVLTYRVERGLGLLEYVFM